MTIATYAELKTAVDNWLDGTHLQSRAAEFIALGESRLNRDLGNLRAAWTNGALTGTTSSRSIALPSTFVEAGALFLTTDGSQTKLTPFINGTRELLTTNGTPGAWSINGTNIDLDCPCSQADTFLFRYRAKWELSDAVPTSWLLTNHPDVYLAVALIEAFKLLKDFEAMLVWQGDYKRAVEEITENEARSLAIAPLMVDAALTGGGGGGFNYTTGQ